jgi:hypothetical protein
MDSWNVINYRNPENYILGINGDLVLYFIHIQ